MLLYYYIIIDGALKSKDKELSARGQLLAEKDVTIKSLNDEINSHKQQIKVRQICATSPFCNSRSH